MADKVRDFFKHITVLGFSAIVIVTIVQVIARWVFNSPLVWGEELSRYIFVWVVMFAVGVGVTQDAHISLTLFTDKLSKKRQFYVFLLDQIVVNAFALVLMVYGFKLTLQNLTILSSALKIPMAIPYAGIPIGVIVIFFFNGAKIQQEYRAYRELCRNELL